MTSALEQVLLHNVAEAEWTGQGDYRLSRIPADVRERINADAQKRAFNTCGCEIRFVMKGEEALVLLRRAESEAAAAYGIAEVYFGLFQGMYAETPVPVGIDTVAIKIRRPAHMDVLKRLAKEQGMAFDPEVVRLILPYDWEYRLVGIEGNVARPRADQLPGKTMLAYGSSITHGGDSVQPTGTYAMRTARRLGMDLINMGSAGSAQMDEAMAAYIAGRKDWHLATVEMGINVIRLWEPERFEVAVNRFLRVLADGAGERPVIVTDLFRCIHDAAGNPRATEYRGIVQEAVQKLQSPHFSYISGLDLLPDYAGLSVDLVHPGAAGHELIAERLSAAVQA
ncbi:GDSL-type esterase/lipase family protein [Paenibacillus tarimensis]|uniref:GDSL-type esterase/lipase family protein n=1 Tax=Paenibacillus tarimensis TaxID=416012 RepID=UPI001F3F0E0A|nr:GDSL-type esterase/lipase family protein [Paenibacillus tarimensis]MCF2943346.1 GDSL-type esterase/lipase family protein [Paenibacillus tarimensis]